MYFIKIFFLIILSSAGLMQSVQATITQQQEKKIIKILSEYYKNVRTVTSNFIHITDKRKQLSGKFYMQIPGKIRFEYAGGGLNIVGSGSWLNLDYPKKRKATRYPISATPLGALLSEDIDFRKDFIYSNFVQKKGYFIVEVRLRGKEEIGSIDLFFVGKNNELRQWRVIDAQGKANIIALTDIVYNKSIKKSKFFLNDYVEFNNDR